jgi:hypothetical protein
LTLTDVPRSFIKRPGSANIPIQAIGLSLYENLGKDGPVEEPGTKVTRTQWLDLSSLEMANLVGKNILIVDEVDDTRTTLEYAVRELEKDVEKARQRLGREGDQTRFSIFVLHVGAHIVRNPGCRRSDEHPTEQGQTQERASAARYDGRGAIFGCENSARRLDLLSMGSYVSTSRPDRAKHLYLLD